VSRLSRLVRGLALAVLVTVLMPVSGAGPININGSRYFATLSSGGGGDGFTPQSGFTGTPASTVATGNLITVTRSSGNFGTHNDDNPSNFTWRGNNHLLALAMDFEDGDLSKNAVQPDPDWSGDSKWLVSTTIHPANLARSAHRFYNGAEQGGLQFTPSTSPGYIYSTFKFYMDASCQGGKIYRIYSGNGGDNVYWSTGCCNRTTRSTYEHNGDATGTTYNPSTIVYEFPDNTWTRVHLDIRPGTDGRVRASVNQTPVFSSNWITNTFQTAGHTTDLGHMLDAPNAGRCSPPSADCNHDTWNANQYYADWFIDYAEVRFEVTDSAVYSSRTWAEMQIPTVWGTNATSVTLAINCGEHSCANAYLHFVSADVGTLIGQFTSRLIDSDGARLHVFDEMYSANESLLVRAA
jgi:hypothetical protein